MNVVLVPQQIVPSLELPPAKGAHVPRQFPAALSQVSGQRVRPGVAPATLVAGEGRVVIDAIEVPLHF